MRIGVLGTGNAGQALAEAWAQAGHEIRLGSRDPASKQDLTHEVVGHADAVAWAEVVLCAVPGAAAVATVQQIGASLFDGKVVLDIGNAVIPALSGPTPDFELVYPNASLGQTLQKAVPAAKVVKSLNTIPADLMIDPSAIPPSTMFVAGDDAGARAVVTKLLRDLGWPQKPSWTSAASLQRAGLSTTSCSSLPSSPPLGRSGSTSDCSPTRRYLLPQ